MLTGKRQRFVAEYLIDYNASAAYQRAGYNSTGHVAEASAHKLLRIPEIAQAIREAEEDRSKRTGVTQDKVMRELARIAFSDLGQILSVSNGQVQLKLEGLNDPEFRRSLASFRVKRTVGEETLEIMDFKLWSKVDALEKLAKILGMLPQNINLKLDGPPFKVYEGFDPAQV